MFKIYDGRAHFFQWDVDRKLIVEDKAIVEVHFCNRTTDCSLVCATYELDGATVVNVPNILLQDNWDIHAYAYCGENYTKTEEVFEVKTRSKPDDYVYTETEIITIARIEEMIAGIAEDVESFTLQYIEEHKDILQGPAGPQGPEGKEGPQGPIGVTGATGPSGVYMGETEPTDETIKVWIKPDGEPSGSIDYVLTDEDKNEIAQLVIGLLPDGEEVSY